MRILIINSRYFISAGPERYMFSLIALLRQHGHEVIVFSVKSTLNQASPYEEHFADPIGGKDKVYFSEYHRDIKTSLQILDRLFYSGHVKERLSALIKETRPDIAYLLHHYNKLSPSVIDACHENDVPVVMRLSDFFLVCPEAHMYSNGGTCEECMGAMPLRAIAKRCVKKSVAASFIKAAALFYHRLSGIYKKVDCMIAPSEFTKDLIGRYFPNVAYIPTFVSRLHKTHGIGSYCLITSRLEENKGILTAIKSVEGTGIELKIAGCSSTNYDKILERFIDERKISNVEFLGHLKNSEIEDAIKRARLVIVPSEWYENMPNSALEAMSFGKPVLASDLGSLREIVRDGKSGFLFRPRDHTDLRRYIIRLLLDDALCARLGEGAYEQAKKEYGKELHYKRLMTVFSSVRRSS